jgi:hypothetical protein
MKKNQNMSVWLSKMVFGQFKTIPRAGVQYVILHNELG